MTMYARTIGAVTITISDQHREDDIVLDGRKAYVVLPLWAAQRTSFQRLWEAGRVEVATDPDFDNIVTEIPTEEFDSVQSARGNPNGIASLDETGKVPLSQLPAGLADARPVTLLNLDGDYTLTANDAGAFVGVSASTSVSILIPTNADVAMSVGTQIEVARLTNMQVYVSALEGVELLHAGWGTQISVQNRSVYLTKIDTDTWFMTGTLGN